MKIGIDCDGVLRDLIPAITESIKTTHPEHADKILTPESWDWDTWLPFWTNDESEKYIFESCSNAISSIFSSLNSLSVSRLLSPRSCNKRNLKSSENAKTSGTFTELFFKIY